MPDWFYRTIARPVLFAMPRNTGRDLALGMIGTLGKSRAGRAVIAFMGHMAPDAALATTVDGVRYASPVGLGWRVDPERKASRAFAEFGTGFIEWCDEDDFTDVRREPGALVEVASNRRMPLPESKLPRPVLRSEKHADGPETLRLPSGKILPVIPWNDSVSPDFHDGVVLRCGRNGRTPAAMPPTIPDAVAAWRKTLPGGVIVVSGGIAGPEDAVAIKNAGADLMIVDAGFVFSGPGLIKRCNAALSIRTGTSDPVPDAIGGESCLFRSDHFWGRLLGASLTIGGMITLVLAYTRVLLPYDEHYLGTTTAAVWLTQPRLFDFMAHDRATLGGVMCGLGLFFFLLSDGAMRRGVHGARTTFIAACLVGFSTFFSFFGFGYFDTLHAFVSLVLLQMTVQVMTGRTTPRDTSSQFVDTEDAAWRRAQWGQLLWIVHAVGLLLAGTMILVIGMGPVFVREDVAFLCVSPERLRALGEKFVAVIAHDRATTGGMLLSSGTAMLLATLWLYRRGAGWLWHAVLWLGIPAYLGTLLVHFRVGYTDLHHLLPAFAGLALWAGGLALSREYLVARRAV